MDFFSEKQKILSVQMNFDLLREKLNCYKNTGNKRAILLSTGSLCPIHKGHLNQLDIASLFLSQEYGIDALVAYISPSCDSYLYWKLGNEMIPFYHRFEMTKLACEEHNSKKHIIDIIPDSWEGSQKEFIDFHHVKMHFENEINKNFPDQNLIVLYVSGADHFIKCRLHKQRGYVGISRVGYTINKKSNEEKHNYVCNSLKYSHLFSDSSSTAIRNAKKNGQSLDGLTYDSVIKYLHDILHWI